MLRRLFFWWRYWRGNAPWDSGITPPELLALVEKEKLPPGRAIDLGCGTGTNSIYLAKHGWTVVGIDYISKPVHEAKRKAEKAGLAGNTDFVVADVLKLDEIGLGGLFDLAVDIGCAHSLAHEARLDYVGDLGAIIRSGGTLMLYMFRRTSERHLGLEPTDVEALFAPDFELVWSSCGQDAVAATGSVWYRFRRV